MRAKRTLADENGAVRAAARRLSSAERLASVLEVAYLIFNEGYSATAGRRLGPPGAVRRGAAAGPDAGRAAARRAGGARAGRADGAAGVPASAPAAARTASPILLLDQDRRRWDRLLIRRGLAALARAERSVRCGPYGLQAAIAACHARARTPEHRLGPDRRAYEVLAHVAPSPVVELNRAVAVGMAGRRVPCPFGRPGPRVDGWPELPAPVRGPRRPAGQARAGRRGPGGLRDRRGAHPERG